jgi:hypothetical protein
MQFSCGYFSSFFVEKELRMHSIYTKFLHKVIFISKNSAVYKKIHRKTIINP